jgi:hypothetical protein
MGGRSTLRYGTASAAETRYSASGNSQAAVAGLERPAGVVGVEVREREHLGVGRVVAQPRQDFGQGAAVDPAERDVPHVRAVAGVDHHPVSGSLDE